MGKHIIEEAKRCIQCKKPRCKAGCPVNTPVNEVIKMLLDGDIAKAGETLFENNPLSVVCSLVCPHDTQCEGSCVLASIGNSIHISSIENYISSYYLNIKRNKPEKNPDKKVAIIGSGPAGITIAFVLAKKGYDITIFEANDKIGGVLRYGIPEFRLPKKNLERIKEKLIELGVKIRPNTLIGSTISIDDLFRDGFKAVFIGTGVWRPFPLRIKGETLGHVHYSIDYLKNPEVYNLGDKVCIIGAGNVAMDVARTAIRNGTREAYIMYRRGFDEIPASKHEVEYAKIDGVKFELNKSPLEILDEGVKYICTEKIIDENGEKTLVEIKGSEDIFKVDSVIISISQGPRSVIVSNTKGIEINNKGLLTIDEIGQTTREGVFASGDVVTGAKTVVEAVRLSKKVADSIDKYVTEKYEI
ncbi:NADPH-dependent glutamate synthase [Gottschalkia acidurici 9a]|uniref:NADPH-dependent glutamate synthase n=1 Tax=Gottschalkia acidurici (strain ATCC 7906 / DSM 604 / BCRC 14475 / CIP 104303 / KCTC 5404 / NCIMB 10678 / 9a) TaxID=1128398 RepID=K0B0M4_GOTA9|nr:NAD(P)-dependent oxidoreductase [Gottschalkia acidurici]AFS78196.1 NADPH-dependent glutamate synthase [Gottschalkia acidurici 9a]